MVMIRAGLMTKWVLCWWCLIGALLDFVGRGVLLGCIRDELPGGWAKLDVTSCWDIVLTVLSWLRRVFLRKDGFLVVFCIGWGRY